MLAKAHDGCMVPRGIDFLAIRAHLRNSACAALFAKEKAAFIGTALDWLKPFLHLGLVDMPFRSKEIHRINRKGVHAFCEPRVPLGECITFGL